MNIRKSLLCVLSVLLCLFVASSTALASEDDFIPPSFYVNGEMRDILPYDMTTFGLVQPSGYQYVVTLSNGYYDTNSTGEFNIIGGVGLSGNLQIYFSLNENDTMKADQLYNIFIEMRTSSIYLSSTQRYALSTYYNSDGYWRNGTTYTDYKETLSLPGSGENDPNKYAVKFSDVSSDEKINLLCLTIPITVAREQIKFEFTNIEINEVDSKEGFFDSIIGWVSGIYNGIVELPNNIKNSLSGLFDKVVGAIQSLGDYLLEGIKGLFVPTQADMEEYKNKLEQLLADRTGALYQTMDIISGFVDTFKNYSTVDYIVMPSVTIDVGVPFTFGGYNVKLLPDGFEDVLEVLKVVIDIVVTILFINTLKRKYDNLVERG